MATNEIRERAKLPPMERAVSDTLDEYLVRMHGIFTSWADPLIFLGWLDGEGYEVVSKQRIAELEAELADWREASKKVLDETCSSDEKHCACVPLLKIELQRLMRLFDDLQDEHLELHQENQRLHNLLIEFGRCQEND